MFEKLKKIYTPQNYKKLFIIPIILLLINIFFIFHVQFGIDLAGGTRITIVTDKQVDLTSLKSAFSTNFQLNDLVVRQTTGLNSRVYVEFASEKTVLEAKIAGDKQYIQAREKFKRDMINLLETNLGISEDKISFEEVGPSTGELFWSQARNALILAFIAVSILIFIFFRTIPISLAVIQSAFFDVSFGLAAMGLFGIPLTLASIAPLLMLIGYSVDTDILLTERALHRKHESVPDRIVGAMKTGLMTVGTTMGAMTAMLIITYLANMEVLFNISLILVFGLIGDIISTWCTNAGILVWVMKKHGDA